MNQTNANHHLLLLRAVAIWRKDLCHYNKTRDNHFKLYGKYFDFTLIVRANASIGSHVKSEGTKVIKINTLFNGVLGYFEFYLRSLLLLLKLHISKSFNFIIAPIGEEPVGWFIRIIAFPRLKIAYDLWDVPGKSITKKNYSSNDVMWRLLG